jgi:methionyl aminopeptidase
MRRSGHIVRQVLDVVARHGCARVISTMDLERVAEKKIRDLGAKPAFKGYYDYPCVLCTSINQEVVHGIPSETRVLAAGDIVSIDCGVVLDGYYGDAAVTVPVGEISPEVRTLVEVTEESLHRGIAAAQAGAGWATSAPRCRSLWRPPGSAWCASLWGTASGPNCTRIRRCPTTACATRD